MSKSTDKPETGLIYGVDDVPPLGETAVLGLQHYLTMFGSTVAIPLMMAGPLGIENDPEKVGWLIGTMFFVSGIATLLQTSIGNRLPIVQGGTFSFLTPAIAICGMASLKTAGFEVRMQHIQGAVIIGGLAQMAIGYSGLIGKLLRFVGPVTIAPTIALIGLALFPFGAPTAGKHWGIGGLTIFLVILFSQILRKKHRVFELFPILLGMGGAWLTAIVLTEAGVFEVGHPAYTSWDKVAQADWFRLPLPFQWGMPVFSAAAIVGMLAGVAASIVESVGDYYACARLSGAPIPTAKVVSRGIGTEGLGGVIAGIIGSGNGTTSYSENIGAIGLTRVGSRRVVQAGAIIMLVLGTTAKFGALFTTVPQPVVGGMYCTLFGMIVAIGLSNLQYVDMNAPRNLFIIGFAFFMGLSLPAYIGASPIAIEGAHWVVEALVGIVNTLCSTGMAVGAVIAVTLDNLVPGTDEERGLAHFDDGSDVEVPLSAEPSA
ncbi:MAG: uracil-xanthine permease family protein [Nannocystales bacterium]